MKAEHEEKLNRTELSMTGWMSGIKLNERKKKQRNQKLLGLEPV